MNIRAVAADVLERVADRGESLSAVLADVAPQIEHAQDRAFLQALTYGVCRWYWETDFLLRELARKPIKDPWVRMLALVGLHQLKRMRVKPHAAVAETVSAAARSPWAKPFLNALLRNYQRKQVLLDASVATYESALYSHPAWMIQRARGDWQEAAHQILSENNEAPPMTLRVNRLRSSRVDYLDLLRRHGAAAHPGKVSPEAVILEQPRLVQDLPGFSEGTVSVQDEAAQLAAALLEAEAGQRVLDVCAAPGGKSMHLLETCPELDTLVALDLTVERIALLRANLARVGLQAKLCVADPRSDRSWWDGTPFERILLDAPCSATGVIRRHPDIKILRRQTDIEPLSRQQRELLDAVWPLLAPRGILLYATCSVIKMENEAVIAGFLRDHADAREVQIERGWGRSARHGRQILPGDDGMDGFYYARITKVG